MTCSTLLHAALHVSETYADVLTWGDRAAVILQKLTN